MSLMMMGKKCGMTRFFNEKGNLVVCTVISLEPNIVAQVKRKTGVDGYEAVQLAAGKLKPSRAKNVSKALRGHFAKASVEPRESLLETRVENAEQYSVGQEVGVSVFADCAYVDIYARSKGKGYQGVMKRHGFAGGPASHGSGFHRHAGSTGMRTSPGRCLPGVKKAGRMGGEKVTVQNLKVIKIDETKQVMLVAGAVPGAKGARVVITKAKKK